VQAGQLYDLIGASYPATRRTAPRIAARKWAALAEAHTVVNVGVGTGSYERPDREVIAVEPSAAMTAQRPACAAPRWPRPRTGSRSPTIRCRPGDSVGASLAGSDRRATGDAAGGPPGGPTVVTKIEP
jgi:hypothetical protein